MNGMIQFTKKRTISQESETSTSAGVYSITAEKPSTEIQNNKSEKDLNFTIRLYKDFSICIYKPLIPLKLMLFFWFGAGAFLGPFITVYFKQQGISLGEISIVFIISPVAQFLGTLLSGVVADKIGRSKPVLVFNLILTMLILISILLIPKMDVVNCDSQPINLKCHPKQFDRLITKTSCDVVEDIIEVNSCNVQCPENVTEHCNGQNLICDIFAGKEERRNFSLSIHVNGSSQVKDRCYYNVSYMSRENETYSWCDVPHKMYCRVSCYVNSGVKCSEEVSDRDLLMMVSMVLYILLMVVYSNCYRFMDVTSMSLVKEHNSDFGRERFFSIAGVLIITPIAGYIVKVTTPKGGERNYNSAFYFYFAILLLILLIVTKLDVRINTPGKKLGKKTLTLLKNPDVVSFALVVFTLGTAWSYTKNFLFWYLEEMKASSILMGLIPAVSALYGLPFLLTSSWWVRKIGATQIFILGLVGYVINSIGYSILYDPWLSLILESTNVLTYHLLWVAVVLHSHEIAPEGMTATVISIAGSIHYHLGKTTGGLIGGFIMDTFNGRVAFRVVAIICTCCAVIYSIYLIIRRKCFSVKYPEPKDTTEDDAKPNGEIQTLEIIDKF
ncbi:major facilitator superfamily domain-containing protein 6 [Parasteatoda tepidariorum]|uniref:major facilitator superfamily domain-containing protein 6 n=1 Tax=Parasteatoda tepidariorum TaxID=114398 RepID=UPI00077F8624|nr:major facilitator superfamily domain-containing protein 6 [Parasteatoda tepidariorum]